MRFGGGGGLLASGGFGLLVDSPLDVGELGSVVARCSPGASGFTASAAAARVCSPGSGSSSTQLQWRTSGESGGGGGGEALVVGQGVMA